MNFYRQLKDELYRGTGRGVCMLYLSTQHTYVYRYTVMYIKKVSC